MGRSCVVPGCTTKSQKSPQGNSVSFHRFPLRRPKRLQMWLDAIGLVNQDLAKHHRICSEHFKPTDFYSIHSNKKKIMKEEAVPTLNLNGVMKKTRTQPPRHRNTRTRKLSPATSETNDIVTYDEPQPNFDESPDYLSSFAEPTYGDDKTFLEFQKERLKQQIQQDLLLFEQQMKILRHEAEYKNQERERKVAENEIRMQLLHTQLEKARLELEEVKVRTYRTRHSNFAGVKSEMVDTDDQDPSIPELAILPDDIQLVSMTNGIHSNGIDTNSDSN